MKVFPLMLIPPLRRVLHYRHFIYLWGVAWVRGDRVRWSGKTGTVLSKPRQCDYARGARGDPFTVVGVEVMPDKSIYGAGATLVHVATLTRLDGPEAVVVVVLDDEEKLEEIARADPLRGVETVEHAALRLQNRIIHVVRRAAELDPACPVPGEPCHHCVGYHHVYRALATQSRIPHYWKLTGEHL